MENKSKWFLAIVLFVTSSLTFAQSNLTIVSNNGKYGVIDTLEEVIIPYMYDSISHIQEGLVKVSLNKKWGYATLQNEIVIPIEYTYIHDFDDNGTVRAFKGKIKEKVVNIDGRKITIKNWEPGKWCILNKKGNTLFTYPKKYHWVDPFTNGISKVYIIEHNYFSKELNRLVGEDDCGLEFNGKVGLADTLGNILLKSEYKSFEKLSERFYLLTEDNKNCSEAFRLYDFENRIVLKDKYIWFDQFHNKSISRVITGIIDDYSFIGKFSLLDTNFHRNPAEYDFIDTVVFSNKFIRVYNGTTSEFNIIEEGRMIFDGYGIGKFGYINTTGNEVIKCKYDWLGKISDDRIIFYQGRVEDETLEDGLIGIIDIDEKIILPPTDKYSFINDFSEGLALFKRDSYFGYLNTKGDEAFYSENKYKTLGNYFNGLARASKIIRDSAGKDSSQIKYGFIDRNFTEVIPCQYDYIKDFSNDNALVFKGEVVKDKYNLPIRQGKYGIINTKGEEIVPIEFDQLIDFSNELALAFKGTFNKNSQAQNGEWFIILKDSMQMKECYWEFNPRLKLKVGGKLFEVYKNGKAYYTKYYLNQNFDFIREEYEELPLTELLRRL